MHIIEKLTRTGNELKYEMTIEDPEMFVEPFVMPTRILRQGGGGFGGFPGGDGIQAERSFCEVYEEGNVTNQLRH
jgi:N-methylhydantoinase B/oxoprolinase/acetone carboxylase alpha subunit